MSLTLHRLHNGLYYSQAFADYLARRLQEEGREHPGEVMMLDYVRCAKGEQEGQAWWQLLWISLDRAPPQCRHTLGRVEICIHPQAARGLKNRLLHWENGQVTVRK